jgi:hypothetical protein
MKLIPKELEACKICEHFYVDLMGPSSRIMCKYHKIEVDSKDCCDNFDLSDAVDNCIIDTASEVIEAYVFLRKHNQSIPDATLNFMKKVSLLALRDML